MKTWWNTGVSLSFKVIHMTRMGRAGWLITSWIINEFEKYLGCKLWGCLEQFCIELGLSRAWAFLFLWDLIIKMISSLSGGAVLTSRSCSASWTSASAVGGSLFRTSLKFPAQGVSISVSDVTNRPFLSLTGTSVGLWYLLQTTLAASSAWLARWSMNTRLSALANLFTFLSDSWYCCLCLSFSLSDLASLNCLFKSLLVFLLHQAFLYTFPEDDGHPLMVLVVIYCWVEHCISCTGYYMSLPDPVHLLSLIPWICIW